MPLQLIVLTAAQYICEFVGFRRVLNHEEKPLKSLRPLVCYEITLAPLNSFQFNCISVRFTIILLHILVLTGKEDRNNGFKMYMSLPALRA
jgi:hypothetical protein